MRNFYMILSVLSESLLQTPRSVILCLLSGVVLFFVYCLLSIDFIPACCFLCVNIFDPLFALSVIV